MVTKTEVEKWRDGLRSAVKERDFQKAEEYIGEGKTHTTNVINSKDPSYGLVDKERHRNRRLFGLHGVGNQNRKNMN